MIGLGAVLTLAAVPLAAVAPEHALEVGVATGYAFPAGSVQHGSRASDSTVGLVPFDLDVAYRLTPVLALAGSARYGVGIPTLCRDAGDCESSLGTDVVLGVGARFTLPPVGRWSFFAEEGIGYEWLTTRLTDAGVTATHGHAGPIFFAAALGAPLRLGRAWTFGPVLRASVGSFTAASLGTPAGAFDESGTSGVLHAWLTVSVRASVAFL